MAKRKADGRGQAIHVIEGEAAVKAAKPGSIVRTEYGLMVVLPRSNGRVWKVGPGKAAGILPHLDAITRLITLAEAEDAARKAEADATDAK